MTTTSDEAWREFGRLVGEVLIVARGAIAAERAEGHMRPAPRVSEDFVNPKVPPMRTDTLGEDELPLLAISPGELARLIEVAPQTLADWRMTWRRGEIGEGPLFFKMGRLVRYRLTAVEEWIAEQERKQTS